MDPVQAFAQVAQRYCEAVLDAGGRSLPERLLTFAAWAPEVYAAAQHLPYPAERPLQQRAIGPVSDWPGLGSFEHYWVVPENVPEERVLSEVILGVYAALMEGLSEDDLGAAGERWSASFTHEWGAELAGALLPLHRAASSVRASQAAPRRRGPQVAEIVNLERTPEQPEASLRPFLGVRFEPVGGGVEITGVHPEGPAAGILREGDFVIAVAGTSLGELPEERIGELLVGEPEVARTFEIYRDGETLRVQITTAVRAVGSERLAQGDVREVVVEVLHQEGAERAAQALQILGCGVGPFDGQLLTIRVPDSVAEEDLKVLLNAGFSAGIWRPGEKNPGTP